MKTRPFAMLVVALFLAMSMSQIVVASEDAERIGNFTRLGSTSDLTTDDMVRDGDRLTVRAPVLASRMKVATAFLERELGPAWASSTPFTLTGDGHVRLDAKDTTFRPFVLGAERQFTMGSADSVRFGERPMWVSVEPYGEGFKLVMDDGNTAGQSVIVAKEWLWERGIHRPLAVHEDGTDLAVSETPDRSAFIIEMPHFSWTIITPAELDVKGRQNGIVGPHLGQVRWESAQRRLEIDVGLSATGYEVLVEKAWVDLKIPFLALRGHQWEVETHSSTDYYVIDLAADQTPTTLVMERFFLTTVPTYTLGDPATIATYAFNESIRQANGPVMVSTTPIGQPLAISIGGTFVDQRILFVNSTYLADRTIQYPMFQNATGVGITAALTPSEDGFVVDVDGTGIVNVLGNASFAYKISEVPHAYLFFDNETQMFRAQIPAYAPWAIANGMYVHLVNGPWGRSINGSSLPLRTIQLTADGVVVGELNETIPSTLITLIDRPSLEDPVGAAWGLVFWGGSDDGDEHIGGQLIPDEVLETDPILSGIPLNNIDSTGSGGGYCNSKATYASSSFNVRESSKFGDELHSYEHDLTTAYQFEDWTYGSPCDPIGAGRVVGNLEMGFGTRGTSIMFGSAPWTLAYSLHFDGNESWRNNPDPYGYDTGYHVYSYTPKFTMYYPSNIQMSFVNIGLEEGRRNSTCTGETHDSVKFLVGFMVEILSVAWPYAYAAKLLVADQECRTVVDPFQVTYGDGAAAGGKLNEVPKGTERIQAAAFAKWKIISNPPSGSHIDWNIRTKTAFDYSGIFRVCQSCNFAGFDYIVFHWETHTGRLLHAS